MIDAGMFMAPIHFTEADIVLLTPDEYRQVQQWVNIAANRGTAVVWRHDGPPGYSVESPVPCITSMGDGAPATRWASDIPTDREDAFRYAYFSAGRQSGRGAFQRYFMNEWTRSN